MGAVWSTFFLINGLYNSRFPPASTIIDLIFFSTLIPRVLHSMLNHCHLRLLLHIWHHDAGCNLDDECRLGNGPVQHFHSSVRNPLMVKQCLSQYLERLGMGFLSQIALSSLSGLIVMRLSQLFSFAAASAPHHQRNNPKSAPQSTQDGETKGRRAREDRCRLVCLLTLQSGSYLPY